MVWVYQGDLNSLTLPRMYILETVKGQIGEVLAYIVSKIISVTIVLQILCDMG